MVSSLTSLYVGRYRVATGPCTVNFVGCPAPTPGDDHDNSAGTGAMTGLFSTPVGGTLFMWTFGTIVGTVSSDGASKHWWQLITDSIQFIATGAVDDGPGGFDPTFAIINFNASGNCIWRRHVLQSGYGHRDWQATYAGEPPPGSRTRYACPSRPRPGRTRIQPAQEGLSFTPASKTTPLRRGSSFLGLAARSRPAAL